LSKNAVAIYARVSTDRQTVDMQIHELKEYIKRRGWNLHREDGWDVPEKWIREK
jgi:DNA invertase Pin-like site-specific DNA recombinase